MAQELSVKVERRPFLLRPDRPPQGEPRRFFEGETETELSPAMQERARGAGVVMRRPRWSPNTMLAHEATAYAREMGLDGEFHHAAAGAYWERGVDLADMAVLKGIAKGCGLDWAELSPRSESGHHRQRVLQEYQDAKDRGVNGTPAYLIGARLIGGDVSVKDLRAAVRGSS